MLEPARADADGNGDCAGALPRNLFRCHETAGHRLRPANSNERRPERLASQAPNDHRISFGCVVVPVAFYDSVISPLLGKARGVVYVLPETRPVHEVFGIGRTKLASH